MKALIINGSPHKNGNTAIALVQLFIMANQTVLFWHSFRGHSSQIA